MGYIQYRGYLLDEVSWTGPEANDILVLEQWSLGLSACVVDIYTITCKFEAWFEHIVIDGYFQWVDLALV